MALGQSAFLQLYTDWRAGQNLLTTLSVWSTAASTGEEPYSIAMTLAEMLDTGPGKFQVHASDIDTQVLEKAVAGVYRQEELRTLSPAQLQRFFLRGTGPHAGMVQVRSELASMVSFAQLNLLASDWALPGSSTPFSAAM